MISHPVIIEKATALGYHCDYQPDIKPARLAYEIIVNYTGLVMRSKFKLDKQFIDAGTNS